MNKNRPKRGHEVVKWIQRAIIEPQESPKSLKGSPRIPKRILIINLSYMGTGSAFKFKKLPNILEHV